MRLFLKKKQYYCFLVVNWGQPSPGDSEVEVPMSVFSIWHKNPPEISIGIVPTTSTQFLLIPTLSSDSGLVTIAQAMGLDRQSVLAHMTAVGSVVQDLSLETHDRAGQDKKGHTESWGRAPCFWPPLSQSSTGGCPYLAAAACSPWSRPCR